MYAFPENDERISRHLETSIVFSGLSNRIQNNMIKAVAEVIRTNIRKDINKVSFVAVEVDETTYFCYFSLCMWDFIYSQGSFFRV